MKSLKNLKLNSTWANRLPVALRQPQWVAAIVSLGFHGVLFAAGPSFSSLQEAATLGGATDEAARRVPLIELTAEEQSRLPDFSSSAYSLVPGSNDDLFSLFPPSGESFDSLPLNPGGGFSAVPDVPMVRPPLGSSSLSISPFPSALGRSPVVIPSPRSRRPLPNSPLRPEDGSVLPPPPNVDGESASTPTGNGANRPSDPTAADLAMGDANQADNDNPNDSAPLDARNGETPAETTRSQDLIARVEYNAERTTEAEAEAAKTAWVDAVEERLGQPTIAVNDPLTVEVPYDLRICLNPQPADGLLGLVALPGEEANTIDLSTTVLKSTGYPFLNQAAQQTLQTQIAEAEVSLDIGALYQAVVKVSYNPDTCIDRNALLKSRMEEVESTSEVGE
jgi:hypothetical protein